MKSCYEWYMHLLKLLIFLEIEFTLTWPFELYKLYVSPI